MFRMPPQGVDAVSECLSKAPLWENRLFMSLTFVALIWLFAMAGFAGKDDKKRFGVAGIINLLMMVFLLVVVALLLAFPWSC